MKNNLTYRIQASFYTHYILWSFLIISVCTLFDVTVTNLNQGVLFYKDTDPYTRALRIIDWLQDFSWHEKLLPFSNYPFGAILHFTRIMDMLWVLFALPFIPFFPLKEAVFYGGMLLSPFFGFLSIITIIWGLRPYLSSNKKNTQYYAGYIIAYIISLSLMIKSINIFSFARPDHHSVMFWIFCLNISALLRFYHHPLRKYLFWCAFASGIGIWASSAIEGFILSGSILLILSCGWIFDKTPLYALSTYALGLLSSTTLGWLINPPYGGYAIFDNTRLSALHVALTALIFASFHLLKYINSSTYLLKTRALLICALASLTILCALFGTKVIFAPVYTEEVSNYFLPFVVEMYPLAPIDYPIRLICLIIIYVFLKIFKITSAEIISISTLAVLYMPICIFVRRFIYYELCPLIYLNFLFILRLFSSDLTGIKQKIFAFAYIYASLFYLNSFHEEINIYEHPRLSGVVASNIFESPRLSFEQNTIAVAFPYHSTPEAITDNYNIFHGTSENELKKILQKHHVTYIYLSSVGLTSKDFLNLSEDKASFHYKLFHKQNLYPWLEDLSSPEKKYYLYKINYDNF